MTLLSDLLRNVAASGKKTPTIPSASKRPHLVLVEKPAPVEIRQYTNAANATSAWRLARDQYLNHLMTCRSCHAPTARHCPAGKALRAAYDTTPMEATR